MLEVLSHEIHIAQLTHQDGFFRFVFFDFRVLQFGQQFLAPTFQIFRVSHDVKEFVLNLLHAAGVFHGFEQAAGLVQIVFGFFQVSQFQGDVPQGFTLLGNAGAVFQPFHDVQAFLVLIPSLFPVFLECANVSQVGIAAGFSQCIAQFGHDLH